MKKYFIFIGFFILLYIVYQVGSGVFLTMMYSPDTSSAGGFTPQEVSFGNRTFHFMSIFLIASIAYVISQLIKTKQS